MWLNKKQKEGLDHKDLWEITRYHSNQRKHRYELLDKPKNKQWNKSFIDEKLAIRVIIDCGTTSVHKFRTRLAFSIHKNIFVCLFSVHKARSLSPHEQVCLITLCFEIIIYVA